MNLVKCVCNVSLRWNDACFCSVVLLFHSWQSNMMFVSIAWWLIAVQVILLYGNFVDLLFWCSLWNSSTTGLACVLSSAVMHRFHFGHNLCIYEKVKLKFESAYSICFSWCFKYLIWHITLLVIDTFDAVKNT